MIPPLLPLFPGIVPAIVQVFLSGQVNDTSWQAQFAGAVSWASYGVVDDSGVTDNTAALNSIPANTTIIADCTHGGYVSFSGTWEWPSGLKVWQQENCSLKSTITTPGVYPITNLGGFTATAPVSNVSYYGMQFSFVTPTSQVRVMQLWADHLKIKYFNIDGSGGFAFLRGSDQEVAYGVMKNTIALAGSPGIRHFGNLPKVATSIGMRANVWLHNLNFQTGDSAFQVCQPTPSAGTWGYGVGQGTDDLLYEDSYGVSGSSTVILVNLNNDYGGAWHYNCDNITFRNVSGIGFWHALINPGGPDGGTHHVTIDTSSYTAGVAAATGKYSGLSTLAVGATTHGGVLQTGTDISDVVLKNITSANSLYPLEIAGVAQVSVEDSLFSEQTSALTTPVASVNVATGVDFTNVGLVSRNSGGGLVLGTTRTSGLVYSGGVVSGVVDAASAVSLGNSVGAVLTGVVASAAVGATTAVGVTLAVNPNGTNNATVTNNVLSAMPTPIVCASGQGNVVKNNTGAADCLP